MSLAVVDKFLKELKMASEETIKIEEFALKEDSELRFEVGDRDCTIELLEGEAEIFGTAIVAFKKYNFPPGSRVGVFSYRGAKIELAGPTTSAYVAEHTPMVIYLNTHAALEQMRQYAEEQYRNKSDKSKLAKGPNIMLVGPTDVGKSTVCRILCNYAVRQGRSPIYVDLDVGQSSITVPGTIGAVFINQHADVVEGFDCSQALVYNFGHTSPIGNLDLYDATVKELADAVINRCKVNAEASIGGLVINTCGWVNNAGYQCLLSAAEAFEVEVVVVLDHERLYNDLQKDLPQFVKRYLQILHQPKSGGVENRSQDARATFRKNSIHKYFYGTRTNKLYPHSFELSFSDVIFCQIGTEKLPDSCLPFGVKQDDHTTKVVSVSPSSDMMHRMFAISPCSDISQDVLKSSVLGFVVVTEMDLAEKTMTILSPQPSLPSKLLIWTEIQFVDDQLHR